MLTTSCSGTSSTRAIFATCSGCRSPSSIACIWPFRRRRLKNSFFCAAVVPIFTSDQRVQDVFLDRRADPPHGVGRQTEAAVGIEALDRLHHADVAFADQLAHRQAVSAIAHGDFCDEAQMGGDKLVCRLHILRVAPAMRECQLFIRGEHREFADLLEIPRQVAFRGNIKDGRGHV